MTDLSLQMQECIIYNVTVDDYVNLLKKLKFTITQIEAQHPRWQDRTAAGKLRMIKSKMICCNLLVLQISWLQWGKGIS